MKSLLLLIFISFSAFANYPVINAGSGVREYKTGVPYQEDEILWLNFDFYRVLADFTATDIVTDRGNVVIEKMVDPLDYLVGLNANVQFQLDGLDTRLTSAEASIVINTTNIATNASNITTNSNDISTNQSNIAINATNIASNLSLINTNIADITTNAGNITSNESRISQNETDIAANLASIGTNASNITTNSTDIATNVTNIATNVTDIATNATNIATNVTNIATNVTDIATNASEIALNDTDISDHLARILVLETNTTDNISGVIDTNSVTSVDATISNLLTVDGVLDAGNASGPSILTASYDQATIDALVGVEKQTVYNTDTQQYNYFDGTEWKALGGSSSGGAYIVGSLEYANTGCNWQKAVPANLVFPVDADCTGSLLTGDVAIPDTRIPAIKIPNARTDGTYSVEFQGLLFNANAAGSCSFQLSNDGLKSKSGVAYVGNSNDSRISNTIRGEFRQTVSGDMQVQIISLDAGASICYIYGNDGNSTAQFKVTFYPDSAKSIETADYTRTHARYYLSSSISSTPAVTAIYDTIYPATPDTLGKYNPGTGIFTETEAGKCYVFTSGGSINVFAPNEYFYYFTSSIKGQIADGRTVAASLSGNTQRSTIDTGRYCTTLGETIEVQFRQGVYESGFPSFIDILESPSSGVIVGDFEEIEQTGVDGLYATKTAAQSLAAGSWSPIVFDTLEPGSSLSLTGNTFVAPKSGKYNFDFKLSAVGFLYSSFATWGARILVDGVVEDEEVELITANISFPWKSNVKRDIDLLVGQVVTFEGFQNTAVSRPLITGAAYTYLKVKEVPTEGSLVANIIGSQVKECETKFLSADILGTGIVTDLTFPVETNTNYSYTLTPSYVVGGANSSILSSLGTNIVIKSMIQPEDSGVEDRAVFTSKRECFNTGSETSLTNQYTENPVNSAYLEGNGTALRTHATLCKLPATTICN